VERRKKDFGKVEVKQLPNEKESSAGSRGGKDEGTTREDINPEKNQGGTSNLSRQD